MRNPIIASCVLAFVVACSSSNTGSNSGASTAGSGAGAEGSECTDHTNCGEDLFCFLQTADLAGKCRAMPPACIDNPDCGCMDEALGAECPKKSGCSAILGQMIYACVDSPLKKEGDACTHMRGCEDGLFCRVGIAGQAGKCEKLPAGCGTEPTCDCLKEERSKCANGHEADCFIVNSRADITCD